MTLTDVWAWLIHFDLTWLIPPTGAIVWSLIGLGMTGIAIFLLWCDTYGDEKPTLHPSALQTDVVPGLTRQQYAQETALAAPDEPASGENCV